MVTKSVTKSARKNKRSPVRSAKVSRITTETQIEARLSIEGKGRYNVHTGVRFLDHMLELFAKHGSFDLELRATGDLDVDQHHTVEDVGIVLGQCFKEALGDRRGINRAGYFLMPLDESLAVAAIDLAGRPYLVFNVRFPQPKVGDLQLELLEDFFQGFSNHVGANVHLRLLYGRSTHHGVEAVFKTFARAMKMAVSLDSRLKKELPSTKGLL
jgi:imidazoleglycerol-phosphate dehydratase